MIDFFRPYFKKNIFSRTVKQLLLPLVMILITIHAGFAQAYGVKLGNEPVSNISIETSAPQMILFDYQTGAILAQKNVNQKFHPASLTKVITAHLVMEKLHKKEIAEDMMLTISEKAWRIGGSTMFLRVGSQARVIDLLHGAIVVSGNDACIALAEGIWGGEEYMVKEINDTLNKWGLNDTFFKNVTGWPDKEHLTTVRDLAIMAVHTFEDFPEYYAIYAKKEFNWEGHNQGNRNPLLYQNLNCDGIKTGHTEESGYSLMASCAQNGRRLFLILGGLPSMQSRADEAKKLISWGFQVFDNHTFFKAGEQLKTLPVENSEALEASIGLDKDAIATIGRFEHSNAQITYELPEYLEGPLKKGDQVGILKISTKSLIAPYEFPLIVMHDLPPAGTWLKFKRTFSNWLSKLNPF